jgi:hypothetical protein
MFGAGPISLDARLGLTKYKSGDPSRWWIQPIVTTCSEW